MLTRSVFLLVVLGSLAACGGSDPEPTAASSGAAAPPAASAAQAPAAAATLPRTPSPPGASAYIISPADGATVSSPVRVVFGLKGFGVVPAGLQRADAGHHHLLIDTGLPPPGLPIPADAKHVHFGKGQTEAEIELSPGRHELRLLVGDYLHVPHDPPLVSAPVTITVQ
jgi:hypothetical protein